MKFIAALFMFLGVVACSRLAAPNLVPSESGLALPEIGSAAISYKSLFSFDGTNGFGPDANVISLSGTLYGTTASGGKYGSGTIFSVSTSGKEQVLYSFGTSGSKDGAEPDGVAALNGALYGATNEGGTYETGTVFTVSTAGKEKVLYSFGSSGSDGGNPDAPLLVSSGTLYGTTESGGQYGNGTVFNVSAAGKERVLYSFKGGSDGEDPRAPLAVLSGMFYGTTEDGGENSDGTAFSVSTAGKERVLHSFGSAGDGKNPYAGLTPLKGTLYGTTVNGGKYCGSLGCGTVFSITPSGTEHVLHSFGSGNDGVAPQASLMAVNSTLYGTTYSGLKCCRPGTIFSVSTTGAERVLHIFKGKPDDGCCPLAGLTDLAGTLYGVAAYGGKDNDGTVFALTP